MTKGSLSLAKTHEIAKISTGKNVGVAAKMLKSEVVVFAKRLAAKAGDMAKLRGAKTVMLKDLDAAKADFCVKNAGASVLYPRAPLAKILRAQSGLRVSAEAVTEFVHAVSAHATEMSQKAAASAGAGRRKTVKTRDVEAAMGVIKRVPKKAAKKVELF